MGTVAGLKWTKQMTQKEGRVARDEVVGFRRKDDGWKMGSRTSWRNDSQKGPGEDAALDPPLDGVLEGMKEALRVATEAIEVYVSEVEAMNVWSATMQRANIIPHM